MRILVLDDSKTVRFIMKKMLRELGYSDIDEAENVQQAWKKVNLNRPDLIISDWNMPEKTGLDFLKEIKSDNSTKAIPFIMATTVKDKDDIFEAVKSGLQAYLIKPCQKEILAQKITELSKMFPLTLPGNMHEKSDWNPDDSSRDDSADEGGIISEITDHFHLVFSGELTLNDFREWLAFDILNIKSKDLSEADRLIEELNEEALKAVEKFLHTKEF